MNKADLLNYMKASHEINRYNQSSQAWKRAFYLAKMSGMENIQMDCGGCIRKVIEWLKR